MTVQYNNFAVIIKGCLAAGLALDVSMCIMVILMDVTASSAITLITQRSCDLSHDPLSYWTDHHQIAKTTCIGCAALLIQVSEGKFISAAYL